MLIYRTNDNLLLALGVYTIDADGEKDYLDETATVQVTLSIDGVNVSGETWPLALVYILGSNGNFQAVLRDTLVLPTSGICKAQLVIDNGADQHADMVHNLLIQTRTF